MELRIEFLMEVLSYEELNTYKPSLKAVEFLVGEAKDYLNDDLLDLKIFHLGNLFIQKDGLHEELHFRLSATLKDEILDKTNLESWCWFIEIDGYSRSTFKSRIPFNITSEGTLACLLEVIELMKAQRIILKHSYGF